METARERWEKRIQEKWAARRKMAEEMPVSEAADLLRQAKKVLRPEMYEAVIRHAKEGDLIGLVDALVFLREQAGI